MRHLLRYILVLACIASLNLAPVYTAGSRPADGYVLVGNAEETDPPEEYVLSAPYPNPFNPSTTFSLTVTQHQQVTVEIFNLLGQQVRALFDGILEAGETHTLTFEAGDLHTGIYLIRVQGETFTATRQVTLLK